MSDEENLLGFRDVSDIETAQAEEETEDQDSETEVAPPKKKRSSFLSVEDLIADECEDEHKIARKRITKRRVHRKKDKKSKKHHKEKKQKRDKPVKGRVISIDKRTGDVVAEEPDPNQPSAPPANPYLRAPEADIDNSQSVFRPFDDIDKASYRQLSTRLEDFNRSMTVDVAQDETSVSHFAIKWTKLSAGQIISVPQLKKFEAELVEEMNKWTGQISFQSAESRYVVRYVKHQGRDQGHYAYFFKSEPGFRQLFSRFKVITYNKSDVMARENYVPGRTDVNPYIRMKGKKPDFSVRLELKSIAEIWLDHPSHRVYNTMVCNPRPNYFKYASSPYDLNLWSGFAITKDSVKNCRRWSLLRPLFNHVNYTWANNWEEFNTWLGKTALLFQQPWHAPFCAKYIAYTPKG